MFHRGINIGMICAALAASGPGFPAQEKGDGLEFLLDAGAPAESATPVTPSKQEAQADIDGNAPATADTPGEQQESTAADPAPEPYPATVPVPSRPEPGESAIEEIVVTAQKREQRLVDVPINVSALSAEGMRNVRVEQVRDVAGYIPNVDIKEQVPGAIPVVTIRGVGLDDFSSTNSPAAGIYVDQVSLSSLALMSFDLYDMERVEVLKGPQGTLYGRNSTAGAINVLSARPVAEREGFLKFGYGDYQSYDAEGMFNLPVTDRFALRLAGKLIRQDEGYWRSRFNADGSLADGGHPPPSPLGLPIGALALLGAPVPPSLLRIDYNGQPVARDIGKRDILLGRLRAGWDATDSLRLDLKLEGLRQRSELGQPESFGVNCNAGAQPIDPDNCADGLNYQDTDRDPYLGDWAGDFPYTIDQLGTTLLADWDLDWATLSSVSGVVDLERYFHIDTDGQPARQFDFYQSDKVNQFSQELRLAGTSGDFDWLGGLFYSRDQVRIRTEGRHQDFIPLLESLITADQDTESAAGFINLDYHLSPAWTLTSGLRYTWETRHYVGGTGWTLEIPSTIEDTHTDASVDDRNWSWKGGVSFAPSDISLIYANVSKGVKSGGFFSGVTTNAAQLEPYQPEQLIAYEVGAKVGGSLAANGSVFYYDYTDVQVFMRSNDVPVQFIGNVDQAKVLGADLDLLWQPLEDLMLQTGFGWLDTELGSFIGPSGTPIPAGNRLANAPKLTFSVLARYEFPVSENLRTALQFDAHHSDAVFKEATNDRLIMSPSYWIYNARVSLLSAAKTWDVSIWGRNLSDERYVAQGLDIGAFGFGNRNYNAPRTFGIEVSLHFFED